jgi:type VI secretion system protein ImpK
MARLAAQQAPAAATASIPGTSAPAAAVEAPQAVMPAAMAPAAAVRTATRQGTPARVQVRAPVAPPPPSFALPPSSSFAPPPPSFAQPPPSTVRPGAPDAIVAMDLAGAPLHHRADALLATLARLRGATAAHERGALQAQAAAQLAALDAQAPGSRAADLDGVRHLLRCCFDEALAQAPQAGGDLFEPLPRLLREPAAHAPLLDLYASCIALGFEGAWRGTPEASAPLQALAQRLHALRPGARSAALRTLSPRWRGVSAPGAHEGTSMPSWVVAALGGVALLALWFALNARLDARARPLFAGIAAVPVALEHTGVRIAARPRLAALLPAVPGEIEVRDEAQRSVIVIAADALFAEGQTRVDARAAALLQRVAQALHGQPGELSVIGHGDNAPPASLQFPTNWHFTRARAQGVADALAALRVGPVRIEGRAEFEPRAANDSAEGRARNRRIDIELRLPRPEEETAP